MRKSNRKIGKHTLLLSAILLSAMLCAFLITGCGEKSEHVFVEHPATESTCTQAGNDLYYTCSDCEKIFDADKNEIAEIPVRALKEHAWNEGVKTADADCEHGDAYTLTCGVGGETKIEYRGEPLGHVWGEYEVTENDLAPNCTDEGTQTAECTRCHAAHNTVSRPALGHSYGDLIDKVDAQAGTDTTPCKTGLDAHFYCEVCKSYFDADKNRTTLEALTIDRHKDESNLEWNTTVTRHEHVCKDCGEKFEEGEHAFADWSAFTCSDCKYTAGNRSVQVFDSLDGFARHGWDGNEAYTVELAELPANATLPEGAIDVGNQALCFTAKGSQIWPALRINALNDMVETGENAYILKIRIYTTGAAIAGGNNWYVFGDASELDNGMYMFDPNLPGQNTSTSFTPNFAANSWFTLEMRVADIKAAFRKQGKVSASWLQFSFEASANMKMYFYSAELYPETTRNITSQNNITTFVKNLATDVALPLSTVKVEATGLTYGQGIKVVDTNNETVAVIYGSEGEFEMPYSDVTVSVMDVLNVPLETLQLPLYTGNIELPQTHAHFYDSYSVAFKKGGQVLESNQYTYDETTHTVTFAESGTYTVEYTLIKAGQSNIPVLTRTVLSGVLMVYDSADKCVNHGWEGTHYDRIPTTLPQEIGKPAEAMDAGNVAIKITPYDRNNSYQTYPAFEIGENLTTVLTEADDSDYISVWIYLTVKPVSDDNWYRLGNVKDGDTFFDPNYQYNGTGDSRPYTGYPNGYNGGEWFALKFTVAELRAQAADQKTGSDEFRPEWILMSMGYEKTEGAAVWVYSAEYHQGPVYTIENDISGVTVASQAKALNKVTVDASGLPYGNVVLVKANDETVATIAGQGEFVMPYANVTLETSNVFDLPLADISLPLYTGDIGLPELYDGLYDDYSLTVKKNGTEVAADKYTFDRTNETIAFTESGVYQLTYTLAKGGQTHDLTRKVTVGVLASFSGATGNCVEYATSQIWGKGNPPSATTTVVANLAKPTGATDVGDTIIQYVASGDAHNQTAGAIKVPGLTSILTNGADGDHISIWMYIANPNTINGFDGNNFYILGNADNIFNYDGQEYRNFDPNKAGQTSGAAYPTYTYTGNGWYELKFTVSDLKNKITAQSTSLETLQPEWILLSFGYSAANENNTVYLYSVEYHKAV